MSNRPAKKAASRTKHKKHKSAPVEMRLRLLRLEVRPVFALDDGVNLTETPGQSFTIAPSGIEGFPAKWAADFAALKEQVENARRGPVTGSIVDED